METKKEETKKCPKCGQEIKTSSSGGFGGEKKEECGCTKSQFGFGNSN